MPPQVPAGKHRPDTPVLGPNSTVSYDAGRTEGTVMRLSVCACGTEHLERIERSWWMRLLFPSRRLYWCSRCRRRQLIRKVLRMQAAPEAPLPGSREPTPLQRG